MISRLDTSSEQFLNDLGVNERRLSRAQRELTSGKRVNSVSDAPDQISSLLQSRADLGSLLQTKTNLGRVKTEVDTAESVVSTAVGLVERARVLGAQGANGTATPQTRASVANELGDILKQLVGIANTTVEGRNIFSGDSDQSGAYSIDLSQPVPTGTYLGSPATREIRHANGSQFTVSKTAQDLFDSPNPGENVFGAINALRVALQNNDQTAIDTALIDVGAAGHFLNQQHSFYGSAQSQVNGAIAYADKDEVRLETKISSIEDADAIAATLELNQAILQQNAALQSRARLPRTSLFDYLG
jgi:flagellar hook-associated protein 3 FlgL